MHTTNNIYFIFILDPKCRRRDNDDLIYYYNHDFVMSFGILSKVESDGIYSQAYLMCVFPV